MWSHLSTLLDTLALSDTSGFESSSRPRERAGAKSRRVLASALVSLTGLVLLVPNLLVLVGREGPLVGVVLSALGSVISLGLVIAGYALYYSPFSSANAVRIAGWDALGVAVLGLVMGALLVYQDLVGGTVLAPAFVVANTVAVGAAAHVIIGVYDARRVRAEQLARERRRLAVLARVLRHNLRNEATVLIGHADHLASEVDDPGLERSATVLKERAETIGGLTDKTKRITNAHERHHNPTEPIHVADVVARVLDDVRSSRPEATITSDVPEELWVRGDEGVGQALQELLENAIVHAEETAPTVTITAAGEPADERVRITVADDGPGIPERERAVVTDEAEIDALTHGTGLGLWVARAAVDACNGDLAFEDRSTGTTAVLGFERCEPAAIAG